MPPNHYQVLGVSPAATQDQIRRAYRALAKQHHPDVSPSKDAAKRFAVIAGAYEVLSDSKRRREYDQTLASRAASAEGRSASDLRQGHYVWVNVAAPRTNDPPDISEVDDLYQTFFGGGPKRKAPGGTRKPAEPQQVPNTRGGKKPPGARRSRG